MRRAFAPMALLQILAMPLGIGDGWFDNSQMQIILI